MRSSGMHERARLGTASLSGITLRANIRRYLCSLMVEPVLYECIRKSREILTSTLDQLMAEEHVNCGLAAAWASILLAIPLATRSDDSFHLLTGVFAQMRVFVRQAADA